MLPEQFNLMFSGNVWRHGHSLYRSAEEFGEWCINIFTTNKEPTMKLAEIANAVEQQRLNILKNNAARAKRLLKDEQARAKMRKAREELMKSHRLKVSLV